LREWETGEGCNKRYLYIYICIHINHHTYGHGFRSSVITNLKLLHNKETRHMANFTFVKSNVIHIQVHTSTLSHTPSPLLPHLSCRSIDRLPLHAQSLFDNVGRQLEQPFNRRSNASVLFRFQIMPMCVCLAVIATFRRGGIICVWFLPLHNTRKKFFLFVPPYFH